MENQRVLITGGDGFIGSNLANTLARHNDVIALDNEYLGTGENLTADVEYVQADVLDEDLPTDGDVVFHLAALSSRQMLEENPRQGARVNIDGFVNVVEQAYDDGCDTIVYQLLVIRFLYYDFSCPRRRSHGVLQAVLGGHSQTALHHGRVLPEFDV